MTKPNEPGSEELIDRNRKTRLPRTEFSDDQRAEIFVRDCATCCFSGANLWLLDSPLRPGYQRDWVDHVKPSARGGKTTIENGVCASHTFNAKKRNNGADNLYLFKEGRPTDTYYRIFGQLAQRDLERLSRMRHLTKADWFFNRAIGQILLGLDYRCELSHYDYKPQRDDNYWFSSAFKKLKQFQTFVGPTLEQRGIVQDPDSVTRNWLLLRSVKSVDQLAEIAELIFTAYEPNFEAWNDYFDAIADQTEASRAKDRAETAAGVSDETRAIILEDFEFRFRL